MNYKNIKKQKAKRHSPIKQWWRKNDYKVFRVIFFPLWIGSVLHKKYKDTEYENLTYSPELMKKYVDKVFPWIVIYKGEPIEEILITNDEYYDAFGGLLFSDFVYHARYKNKKVKQYLLKFSNQFKQLMLDEYEIEGYKKTVLQTSKEWQELAEQREWQIPYWRGDSVVGVLFDLVVDK